MVGKVPLDSTLGRMGVSSGGRENRTEGGKKGIFLSCELYRLSSRSSSLMREYGRIFPSPYT